MKNKIPVLLFSYPEWCLCPQQCLKSLQKLFSRPVEEGYTVSKGQTGNGTLYVLNMTKLIDAACVA